MQETFLAPLTEPLVPSKTCLLINDAVYLIVRTTCTEHEIGVGWRALAVTISQARFSKTGVCIVKLKGSFAGVERL